MNNIHFTDDEIQHFFEKNGFKTALKTFGEWQKGYHNAVQWVERYRLAVMVNGRAVEARPLFNRVFNEYFKNLVLPKETSNARETIEKLSKQDETCEKTI